MEYVVYVRNKLIRFFYLFILKRILFLLDPESVHDRVTAFGVKLGSYNFTRTVSRILFGYSNQSLTQTVVGIEFKNPIGLSAGFDKNALLTDIIPCVGFGFEEIGSVTGEPCKGNPGQRLWRLPKSQSLVVYYGLMNDGSEVISCRMRNKKFFFPIGISIAKTNCKETCDMEVGVQDYVKAYRAFEDIGDYYTINISCPNTHGGQPFHDVDSLTHLFKSIFSKPKTKPVFLKISPDIPKDTVDGIIGVAKDFGIDGFVVSNLTKNRDNAKIKDEKIPDVGGLSGKVVEDLSNDLIEYIYAKTKGSFVIIGCGGVFSAEDAYKKIRLGASLIQMITGMVYQGPQVVSEINQGLAKLLKQDGYKNISEAIGVDVAGSKLL